MIQGKCYTYKLTAREMLTWTAKLSLESLTRFSGQTGQEGRSRRQRFLTLLTSPPTSHLFFQTRSKSRKRWTWSVRSVWNMDEIWSRGPLHPFSGVSYCNPITSLDNDLTSYFSFSPFFLLSVLIYIYIYTLFHTFW